MGAHENMFDILSDYFCSKNHIEIGTRPEIFHFENGYWLMLRFPGNELPDQGWKLHISATRLNYLQVLQSCLNVLSKAKCSFKVVAKLAYLSSMESPLAQRSQVGKFITIYPKNEAEAVKIAYELDENLTGLHGPRIPSDCPIKLDSLVHYRYGSFRSQYLIDEMGQMTPAMLSTTGELIADRRKPYFEMPDGIRNPFQIEGLTKKRVFTGPIGKRYQVHNAIDQKPKGGVYLAEDTQRGVFCVIKEGRCHTLVDDEGRDSIYRIKHEFEILNKIGKCQWVPKVYDFFCQEQNAFLVMEYISSKSLGHYVQEKLQVSQLISENELFMYFKQMLDMLKHIHKKRIVLRDFTPNNCLIADENLYIIDWELASDLDSKESPIYYHTPGYASPQQIEGLSPCLSDDIYSLGCVLFFLLTGRNPNFGNRHDNTLESANQVLSLVRPELSTKWIKIINKCLQRDPKNRYLSIQDVYDDFLNNKPLNDVKECNSSMICEEQGSDFLRQAQHVGDALLKKENISKERGYYWKVRTSVARSALPTNINTGASGTNLFLIDLYSLTKDERYIRKAEEVAEWIGNSMSKRAKLVPGLYFGDSGYICVLLKLWKATGNADFLTKAIDFSRNFETISSFPDLTHGAAGQGLLFLALSELSGEKKFLNKAKEVGDILCSSAKEVENGIVWPFPKNSPNNFSGKEFYGFAHGNAGIGYYLFELFRVSRDERYLKYGSMAASQLLGAKRNFFSNPIGINWPDTTKSNKIFTWWCNGAPGIGQFFAYAYRITGEKSYKETACESAITTLKVVPFLNLGQCHGMAGNGEFFLDLFQILSDRKYYSQAEHFGKIISACSFTHSDGFHLWLADGLLEPSPEYMIGYSGIASFFLRLTNPKMARPMTLDYLIGREGT